MVVVSGFSPDVGKFCCNMLGAPRALYVVGRLKRPSGTDSSDRITGWGFGVTTPGGQERQSLLNALWDQYGPVNIGNYSDIAVMA